MEEMEEIDTGSGNFTPEQPSFGGAFFLLVNSGVEH
jgi:hypothetical protein